LDIIFKISSASFSLNKMLSKKREGFKIGRTQNIIK